MSKMTQVLSSASLQMLTKESAKSFNVNVGYTVLHSYMTVEDKFRKIIVVRESIL